MDANVQMEMMEQHLLFHKAMAEDEESFNKLNGYLSVLHGETSGEKLSDSFDESVRAVFSLVLENGMDPWAINLEEFARLYSEKVSSNRFDILVAGRLLLMAWKILNLQSEQTRINADTPEPVEEPVFEEDFGFEDEDPMMVVPDISISRTYAHTDARAVTMIEILDAFEDAKREAEIHAAREATRIKLASKTVPKFDNKAHKEDDETVVEQVYQRIYSMGMDPMPITEFYTDSVEENITVFVSALHLVRDGKLDIFQETLPYGEILVQIRLPENPIETVAAVN
ncbi:MAG: chromosome segregation protein ScpA [archaeon]|nr:chromosome segregation protein ScpA [archaeon]